MGKDSTSNSASESVLAVYAALGGPTRLALMVSLRGRPFSVGELAVKIGASKANVSHQLGILKKADLVRSVRHGTTVTYSIAGADVSQIVDLTLKMLLGILTRRCVGFGSCS